MSGAAVLSTLPSDARTPPEPGPGQVAFVEGAVFLAQLRREFPLVGFIADPAAGVWIAVVGRGFFARGRTGIELRERLPVMGLRPQQPR